MTAFATHLAESGSLRDGISRNDARHPVDVTVVEFYESLVDVAAGRTHARDFVADALIAALVAR